jgi:hypothetical protein
MARGKGRGRGRGKKQDHDTTGAAPEAAAVDATADHNVGKRRDAMRTALNSIYQLDAEIATIVEEQVKPLREDKSATMTSLRERFGLTAKVFRAAYYPYRLQREAEAAHDEVTQDSLRELFEVCAGGQHSFLRALDSVTAADPRKPFHTIPQKPPAPVASPKPQQDEADEPPDDPEAAWALGAAARRENGSVAEALKRCPYDAPQQKKLKARFEEGVDAEDFEIKRASGQVQPQPAA